MYFGNNGVVIHLTDRNGITPLDNIAMHQEASKCNPDGRFYFSCPYHFQNLKEVDYLILYCAGTNRDDHYFFVAKVEPESQSRNEYFIPKDSAKYSPVMWAQEKAKGWFMLSNLTLFVDSKELSALKVCSEYCEMRFLDRINTSQPLGCCYVHGSLSV